MDSELDVIIIGAGFAGLAAADRLDQINAQREQAGESTFSFGILEGSARAGGRTYTKQPTLGYLDMGGQYLAPRYLDPKLNGTPQTAIWNLVDRFKIDTFPTYVPNDKKDLHVYQDASGAISRFTGNFPGEADPMVIAVLAQVEALVSEIRYHIGRPWEHEKAQSFDQLSVQDWMDANITDPAMAELFTVAIRSAFSIEPKEVSLLHLLHYAASCGSFVAFENVLGGGDAIRFRFGTGDLIDRLTQSIGLGRIAYSQRVLSIEQSSTSCTVTTEDDEKNVKTWRARRVIVAMSPSASARLDYTPPLRAARQQLTLGMPMAHTIKGYALYRRPWWRGPNSGYVLSAKGPADWIMDNTWEAADGSLGPASLMTFIAGDQAVKWGNSPTIGPADREAAVRAQIRTVFNADGVEQAEFEKYVDWDWGSDTWAAGCPAGCLLPSVLTTVGYALYEPFGRIHWSGSETGLVWMGGYMNGAVDAGIRAANQVATLL
ncbi:MAG: NAD(P)/FAD-dependent oxidoreductase [Polyangiaceae bacterium]